MLVSTRSRTVARDELARLRRVHPQVPFPIWAGRLRWSPDGTMIASSDDLNQDGYVAVWDARDGSLLFTGPADPDQS